MKKGGGEIELKLAYFTETYLPNRDGVVSSILSFRKALEARRHSVYIFCSGTGKARKENADPNVFYHNSTPFHPYPEYHIALFPFLSQKRVRTLGCELVHSHGMATMGLAALQISRTLKLPLVGSFHTLVPEAVHYVARGTTLKQLTKRIAWKYTQWYYNSCDATIAPSNQIKEILEEHNFKNVHVIPNGVDVKKFNPKADKGKIRKKLGLEKNKIVLHVGRLVLEKNLDLLIDAAMLVLEEDPSCRFVITGKGPAEKYYESLVEARGLKDRFIFTGFVQDDELPNYYASADCLVFPSKFETQGLVALEAMACGTPVAGADCLGIKDALKNGWNGYLFNPDSVDDCADAVIKTIEKKKAFAKNTRATAMNFSIEQCTKKLEKLYLSLA